MAGRDIPAMSGPAAGRNMPRMQMVSCLSRDGWCTTKVSMNRSCWGAPAGWQRWRAHSSIRRKSTGSRPKSARIGAVRRSQAHEIGVFGGITVMFTTERPGMAPGADVRPTVACNSLNVMIGGYWAAGGAQGGLVGQVTATCCCRPWISIRTAPRPSGSSQTPSPYARTRSLWQ